MLLPETKERELRFKLALRMGLPIFFLTILLSFAWLSQYFEHIPTSFYIFSVVILGVMIYYIFFLIYAGFEERITDPITGTFTREYLTGYLKKEMATGPYTLLLVSIDNLNDINRRYGTLNGDRVLREVSAWIGAFMEKKGIEKFPIGHFKGGDILIGLHGPKSTYMSTFELLLLKADNYMIDDIEVTIGGALLDNAMTRDFDQLVAELFEQHERRENNRHEESDDAIDPTELERCVINALKEQRFSMMFQGVFEGGTEVILDVSVKLLGMDGALIHQKKYVPVINRLGLSRAYDLMLFEHVVSLCGRYPGRIVFALPLFPSSIRNRDFFGRVHSLMQRNEALRGRIMFVLGEKEFYHQLDRYDDTIQGYRNMGILVAFDHYGGNHGTLRYLKRIAVDAVRYDAHLGKELHEPRSRALLNGLNVAAHELGVKTWIRLVEDEASVRTVESIEIDYLQGNFLGTIAPIEDFGPFGPTKENE